MENGVIFCGDPPSCYVWNVPTEPRVGGSNPSSRTIHIWDRSQGHPKRPLLFEATEWRCAIKAKPTARLTDLEHVSDTISQKGTQFD